MECCIFFLLKVENLRHIFERGFFGIEWQVFSKRLISCRHCAPVFIASRSGVPGYVCFFLHVFLSLRVVFLEACHGLPAGYYA